MPVLTGFAAHDPSASRCGVGEAVDLVRVGAPAVEDRLVGAEVFESPELGVQLAGVTMAFAKFGLP